MSFKTFSDFSKDEKRMLLEKSTENKAAQPDPDVWKKWRTLVNMNLKDLQEFYDSEEGKDAGMSKVESTEEGISNGRESAGWLLKMMPDGNSYDDAKKAWTPKMWEWARKQNSFISRMKGMRKRMIGNPFSKNGEKTRWLKSLMIWGHDPRKPLRKV